jgi:hypothetical protein
MSALTGIRPLEVSAAIGMLTIVDRAEASSHSAAPQSDNINWEQFFDFEKYEQDSGRGSKRDVDGDDEFFDFARWEKDSSASNRQM